MIVVRPSRSYSVNIKIISVKQRTTLEKKQNETYDVVHLSRKRSVDAGKHIGQHFEILPRCYCVKLATKKLPCLPLDFSRRIGEWIMSFGWDFIRSGGARLRRVRGGRCTALRRHSAPERRSWCHRAMMDRIVWWTVKRADRKATFAWTMTTRPVGRPMGRRLSQWRVGGPRWIELIASLQHDVGLLAANSTKNDPRWLAHTVNAVSSFRCSTADSCRKENETAKVHFPAVAWNGLAAETRSINQSVILFSCAQNLVCRTQE